MSSDFNSTEIDSSDVDWRETAIALAITAIEDASGGEWSRLEDPFERSAVAVVAALEQQPNVLRGLLRAER